MNSYFACCATIEFTVLYYTVLDCSVLKYQVTVDMPLKREIMAILSFELRRGDGISNKYQKRKFNKGVTNFRISW